MKIALLTITACLIFLTTLTESTPAPSQDVGNGTVTSTTSASMADQFFAFQDQVRHWADKLSQRTRSAFQKLQVKEVNRVMSTWFSELGKRFGGFGMKSQ